MISVIVPVYNVESYLPKCLDSIIAQTYTDLEILVIDDGSTDRCGAICDSYAERDRRIRVFHTENRGLSAARNLGLDHAKGEYIGFVDSDDWIEPDMYEVLLRKAEETGADIVECGFWKEYPDRYEEKTRQNLKLTGKAAVSALLRNELSDGVWNKLWRRQCFETNRFPMGRVFEDVATTYQVFDAVPLISCVPAAKYHYTYREDSLSSSHSMKNLTDCWLSHKERFDYLWDRADDADRKRLLEWCGMAAARLWAYYVDCSEEEHSTYGETVREINAFAKEQLPLFADRTWIIARRIGVFFPHFQNDLSFRAAWLINRLHRKLSN